MKTGDYVVADIFESFHESDKFQKWIAEHDKTCKFADPAKCGASGGRLTYSFTPTSLGLIQKVRCACEAEVDLTDYESW